MAADRTARYRSAWLAGSEGRDLSASSRARADEDPLIDQAHDAGRAQVPFADFLAEHPELAPPAPSTTPSSSSSSPAPSPRLRPLQLAASKISGGRTESVGAVLLGVLLGTLALSVLDYGPKGPLYWFEAKFLNDAVPKPGGSTSSSSSSSSFTGPAPTTLGPTGPLAPPPGIQPNAETG